MKTDTTKPGNKPAETKPNSPPETKPAGVPETKGAPTDEDTSAATLKMEHAADLLPMDRKTLMGDVLDAMLEVVKNRPKSFKEASEMEQRDMIASLTNAAGAIVDKMARAMMENGRTSVAGTIDGINLKDGMKITIKAPYSLESVGLLADAQGKEVLIMRPQAEKMKGSRRNPRVQPDQPSLIPEDDSDLVNAADDPADPADPAKQAKQDAAVDSALADIAK